MAGLQSALLSAGAVVAVALAVVAAAPSVDGTAGVDWEGAAGAGVRVWLLAHAVPAGTAETPVSVVPLGLTVVFAFLAASLARRFGSPTTGSWFAFTATYAGLLVAATAAAHAELTDPHARLRAGVVAAIIAGGGAGAGLWRAGWRPAARWRHVPETVSDGLRLGAGIMFGAWALGAAAFLLWAVAGWTSVEDAARGLDADPIGALALAIGEGLYAPTLAVWGASWIAGPGFAVGTGTEYAPGHLTTAPLPSVPLLGALPHASGGALVLAPLLVVALAMVARGAFARRRGAPSGFSAVVAVVAVGLLAAAGSVAASGSLGGGDLSVVGPEPIATGVWMSALVAIGLAGGGLTARWKRSVTATNPGPDATATREGARSRPPRTSSGTRPTPRP